MQVIIIGLVLEHFWIVSGHKLTVSGLGGKVVEGEVSVGTALGRDVWIAVKHTSAEQ